MAPGAGMNEGRVSSRLGLPGQPDVAEAIQVAREGVPTEVISVPLRYMHSTVETLCVADVERTGRLMARFIAGLDESFSERLGL